MIVKEPSDSVVRAAAIDPSRSFLIQAPAGSGKTELLTDRILSLLATVNRPEEIVAITFTRKAASEMHARVLAKLQAGLGPCPEEAYKRRSWQLAQKAMQRDQDLGWNLLQYPARLSIRTIDSFCTYLVRAMPWSSGLGGVPAIADNAQEHYDAAAQATLAMADENASVAALLAHLDVDMAVAKQLIAGMLASREQWLPLLGNASDIDGLIESLDRAVSRDLCELAKAMPPGWASALAPCVSRAACLLLEKGAVQEAVLADWTGEAFGTECEDLALWQALAKVLLTDKKTLRRRVTVKEGFEAKAAYKDDFMAWMQAFVDTDPWVSRLADIRQAPLEGYSDDQVEILHVLIEVLWLAAAQLGVRFAEAAEVDFAEISQRAVQALGDVDEPSDLLLALDTVIKHILVDEFQDTSRSQIELLRRLTAGWMPDDGRTLFLVGDPMQSIYRFRQAEVGWFLKVKEEGLGTVTLTALELKDNFRSQRNLVHWVNQACAPIFPKESHSGFGAIPYTDAVAFNDGMDGFGVEFHPVWNMSSKDADEAAGSDCAAATESLAVMLAKEALSRSPDSEHPVAILVRARSHLDGIVHRLAQQNIPCRAVELVSLKSRQVVVDLVQLARALSHSADRLAWLSVLRSPLCGLTLTTLHALCGNDFHSTIPSLLSKWLEHQERGLVDDYDPDEAARLRHAASVLLDRRNDTGTMPFAAWVQSCWRDLGGPAVYPSASDTADAESLFRLIEKLAPYGNLNPVELDERLDRLYAAPNSSGRAVEVMTIHKSKGLEFDTVILAGLHRRPPPDKPPLMRFEQSEGELLLGPIKHRVHDKSDPVSVYLAEREKKRAAYEIDRLLYVALTRARHQLHLIGTLDLDETKGVKSPGAVSLLGRLWDRVAPTEIPSSVELDTGDEGVPVTAAPRPLVRMALGSMPAVQVRPMPRPHATPWQWSVANSGENLLGTVAHAWLERLGKEGAGTWTPERINASLPVFRKQLSRAGMPEAGLDEGADILRETLLATLASERGRWLLWAARAHREWALLDASGRVSIIDLAISQEHDWLVVDYKTGIPRPGEPREEFEQRVCEQYREQIERYCAHVSALDGRPARGALYFPRADLWVDYAAATHGSSNSC